MWDAAYAAKCRQPRYAVALHELYAEVLASGSTFKSVTPLAY
jgi:hypothetical protein